MFPAPALPRTTLNVALSCVPEQEAMRLCARAAALPARTATTTRAAATSFTGITLAPFSSAQESPYGLFNSCPRIGPWVDDLEVVDARELDQLRVGTHRERA